MLQSWDEESEFNLGTWEGNPLDMHAALLNGFSVENIEICGEGMLDGQAELAGWWNEPKMKKGDAWRGPDAVLEPLPKCHGPGAYSPQQPFLEPASLFLKRPALLNVQVEAPEISPNTDGLNPESCSGVLVAGMRFSVGDDCIAVKSGKLYMASRNRTPSKGIEIMHCLMEKGHGGVTIGSEMSGGVYDIQVHDCLMRSTDRALRVKTRRGRSSQGRIDNIIFERVRMENVATPLVVNSFCFCDPDGHSDYVQSRENTGADQRTPSIGSIVFKDVQASGCKLAAACLLGLPESKIEKVELINARFSFAEDALPAQPAMADGFPDCVRRGIIALNVQTLMLKDVTFDGVIGDEAELEGVEFFIREKD